jgi:hypothetical protein
MQYALIFFHESNGYCTSVFCSYACKGGRQLVEGAQLVPGGDGRSGRAARDIGGLRRAPPVPGRHQGRKRTAGKQAEEKDVVGVLRVFVMCFCPSLFLFLRLVQLWFAYLIIACIAYCC